MTAGKPRRPRDPRSPRAWSKAILCSCGRIIVYLRREGKSRIPVYIDSWDGNPWFVSHKHQIHPPRCRFLRPAEIARITARMAEERTTVQEDWSREDALIAQDGPMSARLYQNLHPPRDHHNPSYGAPCAFCDERVLVGP